MSIPDLEKNKNYAEGILGLDNYTKERIPLKTEHIILEEWTALFQEILSIHWIFSSIQLTIWKAERALILTF